MYSKDVSSCSWRTRLIAYYQVSTCKIFNAEIIADENVSPLRASDGNSCTSITFQRLSFALSNIADFNQRMVKLNRGEAEKYKKKCYFFLFFLSRSWNFLIERRTKCIIPIYNGYKIWNFVKANKNFFHLFSFVKFFNRRAKCIIPIHGLQTDRKFEISCDPFSPRLHHLIDLQPLRDSRQ